MFLPPWYRRPRDASTDFYHPNTLRQTSPPSSVATHPPRLPPGRPLWCDRCLLTPAAIIHWFSSRFSRQHGLDHVSLLAGPPSPPRFCRPAPGSRCRPPDRPPRGGEDPGPCHRGRGTLVWPSRLADRRLVVLHARCRRAANLLRPPGNQAKGCGFPVAQSWRCSTPAPGCCWRFSGAVGVA